MAVVFEYCNIIAKIKILQYVPIKCAQALVSIVKA